MKYVIDYFLGVMVVLLIGWFVAWQPPWAWHWDPAIRLLVLLGAYFPALVFFWTRPSTFWPLRHP